MEQQQIQAEELVQQSVQVGANIQAFLDAVKLSARTAEDRQTLQVFASTCEIVEKIAAGELVIIHSSALQQGDQEAGAPQGSQEEVGEE